MFKKVLSAAVAAAMALSVMPMAMAEETGYVTGNVTISNAEEFEVFAAAVNGGNDYSGQTVVLANDIDYHNGELTPVGTRDDSFAGNFNGNGYTIKNASVRDDADAGIINVGVFGFVRGGSVTNVNFSNIDVVNEQEVSPSGIFDSEESTTGVAVGALTGGLIEDVTVNADCTVYGKLRTGGISGDASGVSSVIRNCTNYATVTGAKNYTGGIVGATHNLPEEDESATGTEIDGCHNYGDVTGTSEVGGIAGYTDRAVIDDCVNHEGAYIKGTGNYGTGGIVGCDIYNPRVVKLGSWVIISYTPDKGSSITTCTNDGDVEGPRAGGILGSFVVSPGEEQPEEPINSTLTECVNNGDITTTNADKSGVVFGYQITYAKGDEDGDICNLKVVLDGCSNTGTLNGTVPDVLTNTQHKIIN